jgi:hypothetical protein
MASSGMLRRMARVRTYISEELSSSIIKVTRIGELMMEALSSSETSVLTRSTRRNIPVDDIHRKAPSFSRGVEVLNASFREILARWTFLDLKRDPNSQSKEKRVKYESLVARVITQHSHSL